MHLFDVARDFYSRGFLQQKLAWEIGAAVLFLAMVFIGLHMLRRSFGSPAHETGGEATLPPTGVARVQRYELGARLYHWGNFLVIALLLWSGTAFFFPSIVFPLQPYVGFSWLWVHVVLAWTFVGFLLLHIGFSIFDTGLGHMWFHRGDGHDFASRIKYYFAGRRLLPKYGKYDIFQKIYHAFLAIAAIVMIVTGIFLFLSSELIASIGHEWLRWVRILHDIFAFLFAAVIIGHIYLRVLRSRWPTLLSMVTGNLTRDDFAREHSWQLWRPPAESPREPRPASLGAAAAPTDDQNQGGPDVL
jgi:cytochrome b subunit of formate dehydrogenase